MFHDAVERLAQRLGVFAFQRHTLVLRQVPVGKQLQLAAQQRLVVVGQHAGLRGQLPGQQRVHRLQIARLVGGWVLGLHLLHHGLATQVAQQHETLRFVPGQDVGHQQASALHQRSDLHERAAVFKRRWGVHHDAAGAAGGVQSQVAPKAGVRRRRSQRVRQQPLRLHQAVQPVIKRGLARRVVPGDGGWGGVHGGCVGRSGRGKKGGRCPAKPIG